MRKLFMIILSSLFTFFCITTGLLAMPLVFHDDFNDNSLNLDNWTIGRETVNVEDEYVSIEVLPGSGGGAYLNSSDYSEMNFESIRIVKSARVFGTAETEFKINFIDSENNYSTARLFYKHGTALESKFITISCFFRYYMAQI